jgi:hypothetical protein
MRARALSTAQIPPVDLGGAWGGGRKEGGDARLEFQLGEDEGQLEELGDCHGGLRARRSKGEGRGPRLVATRLCLAA